MKCAGPGLQSCPVHPPAPLLALLYPALDVIISNTFRDGSVSHLLSTL